MSGSTETSQGDVAVDEYTFTNDLATTIRYAILRELAERYDRRSETSSYGVTSTIAEVLDWLVRHDPARAQHMIGELVGQAERDIGVPREVTARSLSTVLAPDGEARDWYLGRVLPQAVAH